MCDQDNIKQKILLVAFHSYAGMGPYVISIVNSFKTEDNVLFFLIEREDRYYSRNIRKDLMDKAIIILSPTPNKLQTLYSLITGLKCKYKKQIQKLCETEGVAIVHDLTGTTDTDLIRRVSPKCTWLYTVHDLHPHEAKKSFFKMWRQKRIYDKIFEAIDQSDSLITNSETQFRELRQLYAAKRSYITPFPSLITNTIRQGGMPTKEINGLRNYILFFGRIEEYKGISILLDAFRDTTNLNVKLVIAGRGELPYDINDERIIFINRYINDREIADLYLNSYCVVYPYISATQSGVLAVATYFRIPIIASDVPFFKEVLGESYPGLFRSRDSKDLSSKLNYFINLSDESYIDLKYKMQKIYEMQYSNQKQRERLLSTYESL